MFNTNNKRKNNQINSKLFLKQDIFSYFKAGFSISFKSSTIYYYGVF